MTTLHFHKSIAALLVALVATFSQGIGNAAEPRVPMVTPQPADPTLAAAFAEIRRRGGEPGNMHRTVGNAPKIFEAYTKLAYAIRSDATVPRVYRELIILRTTALAHGDYEYAAHSPMAISCGMNASQVEAVRNWRTSTVFDAKQRALLAYADEIDTDSSVSDPVFAELAKHFTPVEIVELTMTASFYRMATNVTRALAVPTDSASGPPTTYGKC